MKPRPNLLQRLLRKVLPSQPVAVEVKPSRTSARQQKPQRGGIEPLEGRVAPATLVSPTTISFNDIDGDVVTVAFSKPLFDLSKTIAANKLDDIFKFSGGTTFESAGAQQLQRIDLTVLSGTGANPASGTDITIVSTTPAGGTGDGLTNVGAIRALNVPLGAVKVNGDLGQIDAGVGTSKIGVALLNVHSLGKFGATTQVPGTTAADALESKITGQLGALIVKSDLHGYVHVVDGTSFVNNSIVVTAPGKIGSVSVKASLIGNPAAESSSTNTGTIDSARAIGSIVVRGVDNPADPSDAAGLIGGGGINSGSVLAKKVGSITVAGGLHGGAGANSGAFLIRGEIGSVSIGDGLTGGSGSGSASISAGGKIGAVTITGDLQGGLGNGSAAVTSVGEMGAVTVNGSLRGGGANSGGISAGGALLSVTINGNIFGDSTAAGPNAGHTAFIEGLQDIGVVRVSGDVIGGGGTASATIVAGGKLATVVIGGKLQGGAGANSGAIFSGADPALAGDVGLAKVKGAVLGGTGFNSGAIVGGGPMAAVAIGKAAAPANLQGGAGDFSGVVWSDGAIGSAKVNGSVQGGAGDNSGSIQSNGALANVLITGGLTGGGGSFSGSVIAHDFITDSGKTIAGNLGAVTITGEISGGGGANSGRVEAAGNLGALTAAALKGGAGVKSGSIETGTGHARVGDTLAITLTGGIFSTGDSVNPTVLIGGRLAAITAGGLMDAEIRVGDHLGSAVINGDMTDSVISARGLPLLTITATPLDLAIGNVKVTGSVSGSLILAGYDLDGSAVNADASIGKLKVKGNWTASSVAAGIEDPSGNGFGNADDRLILGGKNTSLVSHIAAIVINGTVNGTAAPGDHFGFTAQRILAAKIGGTSLALNPTATDAPISLGANNDVTVREV